MNNLKRREFLLATALTATGIAFRSSPASAATADLSVLAEKAAKEGQVTYYSSTNPVLSQSLVDLFNKTYPKIKVSIVRLASGPLGRRFASEAQAGDTVADILQLGDPRLMADGDAKGWFADLQDLPAYQAWPSGFKSSHQVTVSLFPDTITYNTNLVKGKDIPVGWESVLNDKWRGRILIADIRNSPSLMEWAALMLDTYGPDFLKRLAALKPRYVASTLPGSQLVAAGEAAFVLPNFRMVSYSLIEKGAPLDDVTPSLTSGMESILGISATAKHPNAARLLSNFILTQPGQEALSKNTAVSPLPNIPGALQLPKDYRRSNNAEAAARAPELLKLMGIQ